MKQPKMMVTNSINQLTLCKQYNTRRQCTDCSKKILIKPTIERNGCWMYSLIITLMIIHNVQGNLVKWNSTANSTANSTVNSTAIRLNAGQASNMTSITKSSSTSSLSNLEWYKCHLRKDAKNGCPPHAYCEPQSKLCICLDHVDHSPTTNKVHCLPQKQLNETCLHSAQCYVANVGSACYPQLVMATDHHHQQQQQQSETLFKCGCAFGNWSKPTECLSELKGNESSLADWKILQETRRKCEERRGYLWIASLKRCVLSRVQYNLRVGRAGGGRAGPGGSVGRSTGSRSWFKRNAGASSILITDRSNTFLILLSLSLLLTLS